MFNSNKEFTKKNKGGKMTYKCFNDKPVIQVVNPTRNYNIFFAIDENVVKPLSVSIASILINAHPDDTFNFYILCKQATKEMLDSLEYLQKIKTFSYKFEEIDINRFNDIKAEDAVNNSQAALYRFIIPELYIDIDKALYLDCDIVVTKSLYELYNIDLGTNYIGGVEDVHNGISFKSLKPLMYGGQYDPYFNTGVLLLNCKNLRDEHIPERFFALSQELNYKVYTQTDQDIINIICRGKKLILPLKFNLITAAYDNHNSSTYSRQEQQEAMDNPVILHYTFIFKPWKIENFPILHSHYQYWKYLKHTIYKDDYYKFRKALKHENKDISELKRNIEQNSVVVLIKDFSRLFKDIIRYFKLIRKRRIQKDFDHWTK